MPKLAMLDRPKLRLPRMRRLIKGCGLENCRMTKVIKLIRATVPRLTIRFDSSQSLRWPSSRKTCRQPRPTPSVTMPA
ncbi:hypothetical protein D3C79_933210 [compost metagenome]